MSTLFIPQVEAPTSTSKEYPKLPAGTYLARIIQIIDLGTQKNTFDETKADERKLRICFETVEELYEFSKEKGEQPYMLDKEVTYRVSDVKVDPTKISALTTILEAVNGNRNDKNIFNLINKIVQVSVVENEKGYNKITGFSGLPKSLKNIEYPVFGTAQIFFIDNYEQTKSAFDSQPQFIKDKIMSSPEFLAIGDKKIAELIEVNEPPAIDEQTIDQAVATMAF